MFIYLLPYKKSRFFTNDNINKFKIKKIDYDNIDLSYRLLRK